MRVVCYASSRTLINQRVKAEISGLVSKLDGIVDSPSQLIHACVPPNKSFTAIAYGQTGSGKTYTMQRLLKDFVNQLGHCSIEVSAMEIYNNDIFDLLDHRKKLRMPRNGKRITCTYGRFNEIQSNINKVRTTKCTQQNASSSRSHMVVSVHANSEVYQFVDLAGIEENVDEDSHHINMSLYFLRDTVLRLRQKQHVVIRQSKLTWCLFDTMVANILCICTIIPKNIKQTRRTLEYGISFKGLRLSKAVDPAVMDVKKYGEHTLRLSRLESNLMKDYLQNPSTGLKRIVIEALLHRREMIDHMLKNIFGS